MLKKHLPKECQEAGVTTKEECEQIMFKKHAPAQCRKAGITDRIECKQIMFKQHAPEECIEAGAVTPEECEKLMLEKHLPEACKTVGATTQKACDKIIARRYLPVECLEANIENPKKCERYLNQLNMPPACKEAESKLECELIMLNQQGKPEECTNLEDKECLRLIKIGQIKTRRLLTAEGQIPPFCEKKGITDPDECEKEIKKGHIPPECREQGAFTREACEKVMFEKFGRDKAKIELPQECTDANITDPTECKKMLRANFFPKKCQEAGIVDEKKCRQFLIKKTLAQECIQAEIDNITDCENHLRKTLSQECQNAGIIDVRACEAYMMEHYASNVKCENLDNEQCQTAIKKRLLGTMIKKRKANQIIKQKIQNYLKKNINTNKAKEINDVMPIKTTQEKNLLVLPAEEATIVKEDEEIIDVIPAIITVDTNTDGVPDDIEEELEEVGKIENLSETSQAIIGDNTLEQPATTGEISQDLQIGKNLLDENKNNNTDAAINKDNNQNETNETQTDDTGQVKGATIFSKKDIIKISGTAVPNKTYAVFIYSPVAIVSTVKTDKTGNWNYEIPGELKEGEHQAYLAEFSKDGKILKKSNPFSFLVGTAYAAELGLTEAVDGTVDKATETITKIITHPANTIYYIGLVIVIIVFGIILFLLIKTLKKKNKHLPK